MMRKDLVSWIGALGAAIALGGCKSVECGENTVEEDGVCVSMNGQTGIECGPGTHFDIGTGRCESDLFTEGGGVCGDGTAVTVTDAGVRVCVGLGGGGSNCSTPLPCPPPTAENAVALCGRIYDLEDSQPIDDGNPDNGEPWKTVELRVLDPFAFISNPAATVLVRALPDSCGRYAIQNAPRPPAGFIALAVEDITGEDGQPMLGDNLVISGIADAVAAGDVRATQRAWILRRSTDQAWSAAAGLTGMTFGERGIYVPIFLGDGAPVAPFSSAPAADVMTAIIEGPGRTVKPENDFYFDDTDPVIRRAVSPTRAQTGTNGTGLYLNQPAIQSVSGVGGSAQGTCWENHPAAAPVGAAFVQERQAEARFCQ
jgi:hypothetical protein